MELFGKPDGFAAIGSLSDDLNAGIGLEEELEAFSDYAVIVGDEDFGGGRHGIASKAAIGRLSVYLDSES
jgi:hypothetical protein